MIKSPTLSLITAMAENQVIGRDGGLPWNLPADLERFKTLTSGHTLIMGRRTFESIGRPLPNRRSIILTRTPDYRVPGAVVAADLDTALAAVVPEEDEVFVIGGEAVYREALARADRLYLTLVHAEVEGDVAFPDFDRADWALVEQRHHDADATHAHAFTFRRYDRR